jgi:hypothetical protein
MNGAEGAPMPKYKQQPANRKTVSKTFAVPSDALIEWVFAYLIKWQVARR